MNSSLPPSPAFSDPPSTPRLELIGITKRYPGVVANDGIDLRVMPGQIHAVLGENGAGKSTLMKIVYGATLPDAGETRWEGRGVNIATPKVARKLGIAMVFQHFSLFESLSVAENVWLGLEDGSSLTQVTARIREVTQNYGLEVEPARPVHGLSVGEKQRVEIVRALLSRPQLLILDEPTSVLTPQAVEKLFETLRTLARQGCSILYNSHRLDEIRTLCHHCTVLRNGRVTREVNPTRETNASLSRWMIGSEPPPLPPRTWTPGAVSLAVRDLSTNGNDEFAVSLHEVALVVREREIVGVAGISGNGQNELFGALSGEERAVTSGSVELGGRDVTRWSPGRRRALGLRFVPEERLGHATVPALSLAENTLLTRREPLVKGWIRRQPLRRLTEQLIQRFRVKANGSETAARSLSGGNLQKFIMGREIAAEPRVLIVAQPTWGVDVGAAAQIRAELLELRDSGCAILIISEDVDELFELTDSLVVMANGRTSPQVETRQLSALRLGEWMSGLWDESPETSSSDPESTTC